MTIKGREAWEFQRFLEEKEAHLLDVLQERDHIAIAATVEQTNAVRHDSRESSLLRAVRTALCRIDGGSFGTCSRCEAVISPRRLAAVPWALLCVPCLERPPMGTVAD